MTGRRILLAVAPPVLEGALAKMLSASFGDEVVQMGQAGLPALVDAYDAAVVCPDLADDVRADVVITLPDAHGSAGIGTIRRGRDVHAVSIAGAERVIQLLAPFMAGP